MRAFPLEHVIQYLKRNFKHHIKTFTGKNGGQLLCLILILPYILSHIKVELQRSAKHQIKFQNKKQSKKNKFQGPD